MPDQFKEFGKEVGHAGVMVVNHLFLIQQGYFDRRVGHQGAAAFVVAGGRGAILPCRSADPCRPVVAAKRLGRPASTAALIFWVAAGAFAALACRMHLFHRLRGRPQLRLLPGAAQSMGIHRRRRHRLSCCRRSSVCRHGTRIACRGRARGNRARRASAIRPKRPTRLSAPSCRSSAPSAVIAAGLADPRCGSPACWPRRRWSGSASSPTAWYLWHWPLLAFSRLLQFGERNFWTDLALGIVSLGLAAATHYWIERPIRALAAVAPQIARLAAGHRRGPGLRRRFHRRAAIVRRRIVSHREIGARAVPREKYGRQCRSAT